MTPPYQRLSSCGSVELGSSQMLAKTNKAPLRVGGVDILPPAVRDLGVTLASSSTRIWRWRNTLMALSVVASINFDNFGPSAERWRPMLHTYWYMDSFTVESTTATPSSIRKVIRKLQSVDLLHTAARLMTDVHPNDHITPTFRDVLHWLQSSSGSHTRLQRRRSVVFVVRARRISLTSVRQFGQLPDVPSYALHTMVTSLFRLRNRRHLAVVAFALLRLLSGTVYQQTFSTSTY